MRVPHPAGCRRFRRMPASGVLDYANTGRTRMAKFTLRAVFREPDGKVTNIADSWPLLSVNLEDAKAEADSQPWDQSRVFANAFEIADESGQALTWRPFRTQGRTVFWA